MIARSDFQTLQFLPIEVGGQSFGFPLSDVVTVSLIVSEASAESETSVIPISEKPVSPENVPLIDLQHLFFGSSQGTGKAYALLLSTSAGTCALRVTAIFPTQIAEPTARFSLPTFFGLANKVFKTVVYDDEDRLTLIVDTNRLITTIQKINPQLVLESIHAN